VQASDEPEPKIDVVPTEPQISIFLTTVSSASNANEDTDEAEDDEIHLNQGKGDGDSLVKDVDWFKKNLSHDTVMVEGNQTPSMEQQLKGHVLEKSFPIEELHDGGYHSPETPIKDPPSTNLPILVVQKAFSDLKKRDSMASLRLVFENQISISASTQSTPPPCKH